MSKECEHKSNDGYCLICRQAKVLCEDYKIDKSCFYEKFGICEIDDACRLSSPYGNTCFSIKDGDLEAIKSGKALYYNDGEYGTFIIYEEN